MKLSLTMICKDSLEQLKNLKPLVEPYIDEWIIVFPPKDKAIKWAKENGIKAVVKDFTQTIEPEIREKMLGCGIDVPEDYRLFNFAAARNETLKHVTGDFILWIDSDDIPVGLENLKKYITKNSVTDVFYAVYDYFRDEENNPVSDHDRERVFRNNGKFEWKGAELGLIHETVLPKDNFNPLQETIPDEIFRVEHHTDHVIESSIRNHIALLYEYLKTDGKDARTTYYLGIEYFNRAMYDLCIQVLEEYLTVGGSQEDKYHALLKIAESYNMLRDYDQAKTAYLRAQQEMPNRPDAYLGIGEIFFDEKEWSKAIEYMMTGLGKKPPNTRQALDMTRYTFRPAGYIAQAMLQLGKPKEAYEWFLRAYKSNPKHPWLKEYAELFQEAKDLDEYVKAFVKLGQLSQKKYPKTLQKLAEVVPEELMDQEILMDFKWRFQKPKVWSNKSVVFFCSSAFEDWGPESLETGTGGSEEAVIQLSKRLAKMGWEVTVFNNCIKEGKVDGVDWVRFERFNPKDIFNVIIGWRNNIFVDPKVAKKRFIDMHDVPDLRHYPEDTLKGVRFLVKSKYHRDMFPYEDDKFVIIPNGIDTDKFKNPVKEKNNLVWTSSYDRGLQFLLEMWPDIKKEVPDATIDIYYGFNLFDTTPWGVLPQGQKWKAYMKELFKQDGVREHGRVGASEVAEAYKKADVWAYPTRFKEIDCITASKAMAAKCVPITTDYAVMKERNQGIMVEGDITTKEIQEKFRDELIALLKDESRKKEIRNKLDVSKYDWDSVAKAWHDSFTN